MIRRILAATLIVVVCGVLAIAAWPQLFRLEWAPLVAQIVSLRAASIAVAAVAALLLLIVATVSSVARRLAGSLALVLIVFCTVSLAVLATRGFGGESFATKQQGDITVLSWNTLGEAPGAQAIAELAIASDADIITLPETTEEAGIAIARNMRDAGRPMWVHTTAFDQISKARSTTLLISPDLGTYTVNRDVGNTSTLPTVVATPDNGSGPTIVSVHPVAPVEGEMANWRSDLTWLAGVCSGPDTIMAGDFNSTLDHFRRLAGGPGLDFGECVDAASAAGTAAIGTWPASAPALFGTPIDHVMATKNWVVSGMRVIDTVDDQGSDHRPIVAQLTPAP